MSTPPAGWYPDPSGAPGKRWWDGTAWTGQTLSAERLATAEYHGPQYGPARPLVPQPAVQHGPGYGQPYRPEPGQQSGPVPYGQQFGRVPDGQVPYGWSHGAAARRTGSVQPTSFARRNASSLTTLGFAALYLLLALSVHVVVLGVLPVVLAVRAFRAGEPLAVPAAVAGGGIALFALYELALR